MEGYPKLPYAEFNNFMAYILNASIIITEKVKQESSFVQNRLS